LASEIHEATHTIMTPEKWDQLQKLFEAARGFTGNERDAFVERVFKQDADLGSELKDLLACEPQAVGFLETPLITNASELIGRTIAHYRILERAGVGGMGEVYLADDLKLHRRVALKMVAYEFATDPVRLRRLTREAVAACALNHPNIATIYALEETGPLRFIVMEYVKGQTLATFLANRQPSVIETVKIIMQVADALAAAHAKGIVHRDVKPANIMVCDDGVAKVLDFGIAKRVHDTSRTESTDTDSFSQILVGTLSYMSPEQAQSQSVDHRTDIFSLGVVMYEAFTGKLPFAGATPVETLHQICHASPQPIRELNVKVIPELDYVVRKCVEKDPNLRYQSAAELVIDLKNLSRETSTDRHQAESEPKPHDLPIRRSSFIGRKKEVMEIRRWLSGPQRLPPLVLLTGPAGVGKSRVALQVALELSSDVDVVYVDCASTDDESFIGAVGSAFGVDESLWDGAAAMKFFRSNPCLLVLDNCDRVFVKSFRLGEIASLAFHPWESAHGVLLTSRVRGLANSALRVLKLKPLELTEPRRDCLAKDIKQIESVRLFVDRASTTLSEFKLTDRNAPTIADICSRLDGLPLAIELAAARLRTVSLDQLRDRLDLRFLRRWGILKDAQPALSDPALGQKDDVWDYYSGRHGGLEASINWSYEMLSLPERVLFARLSIADDWSLEAVESLCSREPVEKAAILDLLTNLSEKSLIVVDHYKETVRYRILNTVREFGIAKIKELYDYDRLASNYAHYYLDLNRVSLAWLHLESRNLKNALAWAAEHEPLKALSVAMRMGRFWFVRKEMVATALETMARRAHARKDYLRTFTLLAAAKNLRPKPRYSTTSLPGPADPDDFLAVIASSNLHELNYGWSDLGEPIQTDAWTRGTKMTLEEAIEYALMEPHTPDGGIDNIVRPL
jgi:serine/threonine protein kinase